MFHLISTFLIFVSILPQDTRTRNSPWFIPVQGTSNQLTSDRVCEYNTLEIEVDRIVFEVEATGGRVASRWFALDLEHVQSGGKASLPSTGSLYQRRWYRQRRCPDIDDNGDEVKWFVLAHYCCGEPARRLSKHELQETPNRSKKVKIE